MDLRKLDTWCEWGIVGLVLLTLAFGPLGLGAVRVQEFLVLHGLMVAAMALWMVRFAVNPAHRLQWPPAAWAVLAFVGYAVVRYLQADIEFVARQELIRVVLYGLLFFVILNNLHHQTTIQIAVGVLLSLATLQSLYAVYQFVTDSQFVLGFKKPPAYLHRASGTYICPNHLGGYLEMLLPLALAYVLLGKLKHVTRVLVGYAGVMMLTGIGMSVSRGAWLSSGVALLVFLWILWQYRGYRLAVLISLAVLLAGGGLFYLKTRKPQQRLTQMFVPNQLEDASVRFRLWGPTVKVWRDHLWFGGGPGHFDYRFRKHRPPELQTRPHWSHNDYLNALADWGLVGAGLILGMLGCLTAGVVKTWRYVHRAENDLVTKRSNRAALVMGASVGLIALLVHSAVDFNLQIPANAMLAVTLMALLTSHLRFATDNYWVKPRGLGRGLAVLVCALAVVYLGDRWWATYRQHTALAQADVAATYADQRGWLLRAWEADPRDANVAYKLGESFREEAWQGAENYRELIAQSLEWLDRTMRLNPLEAYAPLRYGMGLVWLRRFDEAEAYFVRAHEMDPNNYYLLAMRGWFLLQKEDYRGAKEWLEKSLSVWPRNNGNWVAENYLDLVNRRLEEQGDRPGARL